MVEIDIPQRRHRTGRPLSDIRLWVEENYEKLAAGTPDFVALAHRLNQEGRRDAYGRKLTSHTLSQAFRRAKEERSVKPASTRIRPKREQRIRPESVESLSVDLQPISPKEPK